MLFDYRAFWLAKDVQQGKQYEDAFRVDDERGIAAIADGVSSSYHAADWARLLVRSAVDQRPDIHDGESVSQWLAAARRQWVTPLDLESLPWHQKAKAQEGASATLLTVELFPVDVRDARAKGDFRLVCYAVGDCCLFHVRNDQVLRVFPIESSQLFDRDPPVIGSVNRSKDHLLQFDTLEDYCLEGDLLVLATDAMAAWALRLLEAGRSPEWERFWDMSEQEWEHGIYTLREQRQMRYDDATIVLLRLGAEMTVQQKPLGEQRDLKMTWTDQLKQTWEELKRLGSGRR